MSLYRLSCSRTKPLSLAFGSGFYMIFRKYTFHIFFGSSLQSFFVFHLKKNMLLEVGTTYIGLDHVQMTKVNWRLKVNWKNLQKYFLFNLGG